MTSKTLYYFTLFIGVFFAASGISYIVLVVIGKLRLYQLAYPFMFIPVGVWIIYKSVKLLTRK